MMSFNSLTHFSLFLSFRILDFTLNLGINWTFTLKAKKKNKQKNKKQKKNICFVTILLGGESTIVYLICDICLYDYKLKILFLCYCHNTLKLPISLSSWVRWLVVPRNSLHRVSQGNGRGGTWWRPSPLLFYNLFSQWTFTLSISFYWYLPG